MKRIACLLIVLLLALTACGKETLQETAPLVPTQPEVVAIDREEMADGKNFTIHTQVELPDLAGLETVTLVFDEDNLQTMVSDLITEGHPDIREETDGTYRLWAGEEDDRLTISLACQDAGFDAGWVYYLDVSRDRNGSGMGEDDENCFTYGYETPHVPTGLAFTGKEAGQTIGDLLSGYSCFTYATRSIIAQDAPTGGYYQAAMEPQFQGLPVVGLGPLRVSACISEEGVFTFQGVLALKELGREKVEPTVTLEQAVEAFREELAYMSGTGVEVVAIRPGYLARSGYAGEWTLRPAWLFDYVQAGGGDTTFSTLAFPMDGGTCQKLNS